MRIVTWLTHRSVPEWTLDAQQAQRLAAALPGASVTRCSGAEEFRAALREAEVAVTWRFEQAWFADAPRLRILGTPAAGREYLAVRPPEGVTLHFGSFHGAIIGETVLAWMLGFSRGVLQNARAMQPPHAEPWPRQRFGGQARRLHGAHVAILGFGHIGTWVARHAKAFGARVTGFRRTPPAAPPGFFDPGDRILGMASLEAVLPSVDHLVLVLPGTPDTDRILDARRLALLPPTAFLYNVGRGNSIDEAALVEALRSQRLAGAALDVFATEPLPGDHPLRTTPNAFLYPHASAIAPDYLDLYLAELAAFCAAEARG